jgi:uncharacterized membrane protein YfcA
MIDLSLSPAALAWCAAVLVASYALRGSTGFGGFAAMPLMALAVPMTTLVPLWTLLVVTSSATLAGRDRHHVAWRDIAAVMPASLVGIALGLYAFTAVDGVTLARAFGALVLAYAFHTLWKLRAGGGASRTPSRALGQGAGLLAGAMGTVFGTMSSVFFAIYLDARKLDRTAFRATLSLMMLALAIVRGAGYLAVGIFERETLVLFVAALPFMGLGIWLGDRVHARIDESTFRRLVCAVLVASGVALVLRG